MANLFNLAQISALAASGAYGGQRVLSADSEALALSTLLFWQDLDSWAGALPELTTAEIDQIKAMVAQLQYDLMEVGTSPMGDYVKIDQAEYVADTPYAEITGIPGAGYHAFKLFCLGLKTDDNSMWVDDILLQFNGNTDATKYDSFTVDHYFDNTIRYEFIGTQPGINCKWAASTIDAAGRGRGQMEATIFNPHEPTWKQMSWESNIAGFSAGRQVKLTGNGTWENNGAISSIRILPRVGSNFVINPLYPGAYPPRLLIALYGIA